MAECPRCSPCGPCDTDGIVSVFSPIAGEYRNKNLKKKEEKEKKAQSRRSALAILAYNLSIQKAKARGLRVRG